MVLRLKMRLRSSDIPLLSQGGVDATSRKISRSDRIGSGRGGWFKSPIIGSLNQPLLMLRAVALALRARLLEANVASRNLLDRAATPPCPRRGISLHSNFTLHSNFVPNAEVY
jgi:hypothetical protein